MTLPNIPQERLEQMIHLACCCKQDCKSLTWFQRVKRQLQCHPMAYGLGTSALSASCIALMLATPTTSAPTAKKVADLSFSDYMMQDLLESLT